MFCHNCGTQVDSSSKFCHNCGANLNSGKENSNKEYSFHTIDDPVNPPVRKRGKGIWLALAVLIVAAAVYFVLNPCMNGHNWAEADCTNPETCERCGETQGKALGHKWSPATCVELKTCSVCGETEGDYADHKWKNATCTDPKTCSVCGETEGGLADHSWKKADCTNPKTCSVCGKKEGSPLGHSWRPATDRTPEECAYCGIMTPMSRPQTGTVYDGKDKTRSSTILVENESDLDSFIILKDAESNKTVYSFYIRAYDSKHVSVPSGVFYLYLSQGKDWYGTEHYFGDGTEPVRDPDIMDFNKYWWTYTIS